jgi:predicted MPP superfamily phosphohydrolase
VTLLFFVSTVIDAGALVALLRGPARVWVALLTVAGAVKLALVGTVRGERFGVLHLVYLDLVVALPLVGLALLATRRDRGIGWTAAAIVLLLPAPVGAYASFVEPDRLEIERTDIELPAERAGSRDLRIAVLADIQTDDVSDYDRKAVRRVAALRPDIVLIPGDVFQMKPARFERELSELRALVRRLRAPGGVFLVPGDTDSADRQRHVIEGTDIRLLVNDVATTRVAGRRVTVAGVERDWSSAAAGRATRELERRPGADDVRVLLAHKPDAVFALPPRARTDLVVAGHTHGGQVNLPLFGPLVTLTDVPRDVAAGGLHELDGRRIYVSRGVGVERGDHAPRIRFNCPPELSLLTLRD